MSTNGKEGMPRKTLRIPVLMLREFHAFVVKPDGRSEAEIIRALISEAIKEAKRAAHLRDTH